MCFLLSLVYLVVARCTFTSPKTCLAQELNSRTRRLRVYNFNHRSTEPHYKVIKMQNKVFQNLFLISLKRILNVSRKPPCSSFHVGTHILCSEQSSWKNAATETKIDFSKVKPDEFGTLSPKIHVNEKLDKLPKEEEEEEIFDITNEEGRKNRKSLGFYEKLIKKLLEEKKIVDAIDVLETRMLKKDKVRPGYYVYNLLINGCAKVGYTEKAFKLYRRMLDRRIKNTPATFTGLFNACANSPFREEALIKLNHLRKQLAEKNVVLTLINYNAMIKAYARLKDTYSAFLAADEMLSQGYSLGSDTCCFLFQSCISDNEAGLRHALLVWHKMRQKKIVPNLYHYNLLIRCIRDCGFGDEEEVYNVLQQILLQNNNNSTETTELSRDTNPWFKISWKKKSNDTSDSSNDKLALQDSKQLPCTHSEIENMEDRPNLLDKNPRLGNILAVKAVKTPTDRLLLLGGFKTLIDQMKKDNVKPDIKTFTQLLNIMPSSIEAEKHLLNEIQNHNVDLDIDFCNMLIKQRAYRSDYQSAKDVLTLIQSNYLNPDIVTFGVLALSCKKQYEAEELIYNMNDFGYRLNVEILGAMLSQACFHLNFQYVIYIMKLTRNLRIKPTKQYMERLDILDKKMAEMLRHKKQKSKSLPQFVNEPRFIENYRMFKEFYDQWKTQVTVFVSPHPYRQFKKIGENNPNKEECKSEMKNRRNNKEITVK